MIEDRRHIPLDLPEELAHSGQPAFGFAVAPGGDAGSSTCDRKRCELPALACATRQVERLVAERDCRLVVAGDHRQLGKTPCGGQPQVGSARRLAKDGSRLQVFACKFPLSSTQRGIAQ